MIVAQTLFIQKFAESSHESEGPAWGRFIPRRASSPALSDRAGRRHQLSFMFEQVNGESARGTLNAGVLPLGGSGNVRRVYVIAS